MMEIDFQVLLQRIAAVTGQPPEVLLRLAAAQAGPASPPDRLAQLADLLRAVEGQPVELTPHPLPAPARAEDWLWGKPTPDPGTGDFGPALSAEEIEVWESAAGVRLPEVLRRAFLQQNGGMNRTQRLFLHRLEEWEPAGLAYFSELGAEPPAGFAPELTLPCGYDDEWDTGLFLAYRAPDDPAPSFYGYWTDGGSLAWTADPAELM